MISLVVMIWLLAVLGLPLACVVLAQTQMTVGRLRVAAIVIASLLTVTTALPFFWASLRGFHVRPSFMPGTGAILRLDELSLVLPALAAGLWLFTVVATPTLVLGSDGLRLTAQSTLFTLTAFLTEHPLVLALAWAGSVATLRGGLMTRQSKKRHAAGAYLGVSALLVALGAILITLPARRGSVLELTALGLIVAGAMIRKGIFPTHAWVPALFEHGRLGPAILFSSPQVGTYAIAVLVFPRAPAELFRMVELLSLFTGVYAAAQAIVQRSARRACAYLFVSQSALVLAGLDCRSREALTGALVLWLSSSISFAGLGRCLLVLEARRGELDLHRHHGAYERKPLLAATFLLLGLSYSGFPGTLGFVGEELLLSGAVATFPWLGFLVVASSALTGIAVIRMYFALFAGRSSEIPLALKATESVGFVAIVAVVILSGLVPAPLVRSREQAVERLLAARASAATPSTR